MNNVYRIVWNQVLSAWVAVAESAKGRGKGSSRKLVAAALSLSTSFALAAPAGGEVVSGTGNIAHAGNTTTITQSTQNLSLNWKSFNIGTQETVNFVQPSASATAVNRIFDTNGSQILGRLNANGQVFLINPNGILFGQGAQVNVGGLVASTLDLNDASLSGNARLFSGAGAGSIDNQGTINAASGGYVALLGNTVSNQGTLTAPLGTVALAAGNAVTLNFNGNSLVKMQVDQSVLNSLADNGGLIKADGGMVLMSAGAKDALLASVVNNTGKIEARTVENQEGTIILLGGMATGTTTVGGTLDASAPNGGNGGFIETSAAHVKIADDVKITTAAAMGLIGTWLIDPVDFTIAASGGNISGANLGNLLNSNSITIQTATGTNSATNLFGTAESNGDIHVNDAVSWSADLTLTLDAYRNININQSITATGAEGKLVLKYGQGTGNGVIDDVTAAYNVNSPVNLKAGNNFSTQQGSTGAVKDYTVITSLGVQGSTTKTDLQGISGGLTANYALGGNIDASVTSTWNAGAGFTPIGLKTTTYDDPVYGPYTSTETTPFTGIFDGLGHSISNLSITQSSVMNVGLIGQTGSSAVIRNLGIQGGSIVGLQQVGPLVGTNYGKVSNVYATADVSGSSYLGGLVGLNFGSISKSYAAGNVSGNGSFVAGFAGGVFSNGSVDNSYATGNVSSNGSYTAGFVGYLNDGSVSNSYAAGLITSTNTNASGLVGLNTGVVTNSFWNITTSGEASSTGGAGLTAAQMTKLSSFSDWDISNTGGSGNVWRLYEGQTAPLLTSFMTGLTLSDASVTYSGTEITGTTTALSGVSGMAAKGTNAGTYFNSYFSTQQGYDISGGNLTINAAPLSAISLSGTRAYDGTVDVAASIFTLSGLVSGQYLTLTGSGTVADKNVGTDKVVTLGTLTLGNGTNGSASNYTFSGGTQKATITKANLTVTAATATKTYDSALNASGSGIIGTLAGAGESVLSSGTQAFLDKNAGTGKTVRASGVTIKDAANVDVSFNYDIAYTDNTTSSITKADLTVSGLSATGKVYDTLTTAALTGTAGVTALAMDVVTLSGSAAGTFADKNAATDKAVTVTGVTLAASAIGNDNANYNLVQQTGLTATVEKAPLIYTAAPANFLNGQTPNALSGTVTGFAGSDALINAASGSLTWTTAATASSQPGSYFIEGSGLLASNYSLSQAASNATALTLAPATPPVVVLNAIAQLASITVAPQASSQAPVLSMSPAVTWTQVNTSIGMGPTSPALQIVNGGMRLPVAMVNVNE